MQALGRGRVALIPGLVFLLVACSEEVAALIGGDASLPDSPPADMTSGEAEPPGIGAPCDVLIDAGPASGAYNSEALTCPSRICLKPVQAGLSGVVDTGPYCAAPCALDSDCGGQVRDPADPADRRCQQGFTCGIAFVKGKLCCQKLCLCKDFLGPQGGPTPIACQGEAASTCN